jgi:hypothetical protein
VKSFKLDWKGWWLLRTPMSKVPDLGAKTAVFAVLGARLKKIGDGIGSSARELVLFGSYNGDAPVRDYLERVQKMSLGVFAYNRCKEIGKQPIVFVAEVDAGQEDLAAIVSLLYEGVPFAPKHSSMPAPYRGGPFHVINAGKNPGLPEEVFRGGETQASRESGATVLPEADAALAQAIAREVTATRRVPADDVDPGALPTERVQKSPGHFTTEKLDRPPRFVETSKVDRDSIAAGVATERVDKPSGYTESDDKTEFVPKPAQGAADDSPTILDEAEQEAT